MFRIGEFSRIARVSCRLLRYYEERGLLRPLRTDAGTGYRYYSAAQLPELNRILVLQELGLSLEQISRLIAEPASAAMLREMLIARRGEIEQSIALNQQRLGQIEGRLALIEASEAHDLDDVLVREEPGFRLLSVRRQVASFTEGISLIAQLAESVPKVTGAKVLDRFVAIAHSPEFEPDELDVEFGYRLRGDVESPILLPGGMRLEVRELPGEPRMATCVRHGPPQDAHRTTARIGRHVEAGGFRISGPSREVFLQGPDPRRMDQSIVEMQFPIAIA
jgi:DNA-binding transcriptional MerR regulator/effector-binding domain-containing protein